MENQTESSQNINTQKEIEELYKKARDLKKTLPKKYKRKVLPQAISSDDFYKILETIDSKKESSKVNKIAFLLAYESGLRISEVTHLTKDSINLTQKSIFVKEGKFSKDRVVPLPKTWKSYMINYIPINKGKRMLEKAFKNAVRKAGVNPIYHFHSLRHSFATHCLERGMPINQVQILMGHSSVGTTNVYIQANPIDALNKYQEVF